jgi:hypothetical protein
MWVGWLLLVFILISLVIVQAVLLVRDFSGVTPPPGEWSPEQYRVLKLLRVSGGIGMLIVWSALVYVLIDTGGWHLMQPWRNRTQAWAVVYSLLYTSLFLGLMRTPNWLLAHASWRPSYRLAFQAFIICVGLVTALASIADLYYPPPMGSRALGLLSPDWRASL